MRLALVNGKPAEGLSVWDRGLQYGDGLFETMAVRSGNVRLLPYHEARLARGCARLGLPMPDPQCLGSEIAALAGRLGDGVVKLILTRGEGERGYRPPPEPVCNRLLLATPCPGYSQALYRRGVRVRICQTRLGANPALAGLKHLNRLEQVMARGEWSDPGIPEGLMLDAGGNVVCATAANLFLVRDDTLLTPSLETAGVAGVMRAVVLEAAAAAGRRVEVRPVALAELEDAEEVMLTNSLIGLWPVRQIEARSYRVGPVAQWLGQALERRGVSEGR